jgi:hypothetical protein
MGSHDLRRILAGWDYEPNQITVRRIVGDDGTVKLQMRLDLGVLQMEVAGRPDGKSPHGFQSLLEYHQHRRRHYVENNGTDLGFELTPGECQSMREEAVQYYHRYLAEFVLEDFEGVERDTARNLQVLDLCCNYAREESDRMILEQYRPYLVMMNTRAQAHLALRNGSFKTALARVEAGLSMIYEVMAESGQEEIFEETTEVNILRALRQEIATRLPADPLQRLEEELERAVLEERYEDATVLRDRMDALKAQRALPIRKRKE